MGTRSIIRVYEKEEFGSQILTAIYQQYDGYLSGVGASLKDKFQHTKIINGICNEKMFEAANGMKCLAAQIIVHFKEKIGGCYILSPGADISHTDYVYDIREKNESLWCTVFHFQTIIFDGWLKDLKIEA